MGKIYRSTDHHIPKGVRELFKLAGWQAERKIASDLIVKAYDPGAELIIEGIANVAKPDRVQELIRPGAWGLANYNKNPVILMEHNRNWLVGRAMSTSVDEGGLFVRGLIGNPKLAPLTEKQLECRSLLAQEILRAFSVGFIPHAMEFDESLELLAYTIVELLEISLVSIPMQQDSIITSVKGWRSRNMSQENQQTPVEKAIADQTTVVKECHGMLTAITNDHAKTVKTLQDEIAALKAKVATVEGEKAALKTEYDELDTQSKAVLAELQKRGIVKSPA